MSINLEDLPKQYREQAEIKLGKMKGPVQLDKPRKQNKHRNTRVKIDGISFMSKSEGDRYCELMLLLKAGEISGLKLQPAFTLQEAFTTPQGEKELARKYIADFSYYDKDGKYIVEDVKSEHTRTLQTYRDKYKEVLDKFGIKITEVVR